MKEAEVNNAEENYIMKPNINANIKPIIEKEADLKIKKIDVTKERV